MRRLLPSLQEVIFIVAAPSLLLSLQGAFLGEDGDVAWNLRIGEYILAHGLPRTEFLLQTTLGRPTVYFEWLAQLVYGLALQAGGLNGVAALAAILAALELALLFSALRRRGAALPLALLLTLAGALLLSSNWPARDEHFTLLLTFLWSELLLAYWRSGDRRVLGIFPLSAVLWANLHPGFIAGLLMLGAASAVAWLTPSWRGKARPAALSLTTLGAVAATLCNPWGVGLWQHILTHLSDPLVSGSTREFLSPDFHILYAQVFLVLLLLLVAAWMWIAYHREPDGPSSSGRVATDGAFSPLAFVLALLWTLLALQSVRFVALWALVVLPILGAALTAALKVGRPAWPERWNRLLGYLRPVGRRLQAADKLALRGPWSGLAVALLLVLVLGGGRLPVSGQQLLTAQFDPHTFPVAAVDQLAEHGIPPGNGFTTYTWGGYLDFALPAYHPFVDSRSDAYGRKILQQYLDIVGLSPDWRSLLAYYHIRWALLPVGEPLAQLLALSPGWRCEPADSTGVAVLCQQLSAEPPLSISLLPTCPPGRFARCNVDASPDILVRF
jgi:hypothetical protein